MGLMEGKVGWIVVEGYRGVLAVWGRNHGWLWDGVVGGV